MRRYREKREGGSGSVLQDGVAAAGCLLIVLGTAGPVLAHMRTCAHAHARTRRLCDHQASGHLRGVNEGGMRSLSHSFCIFDLDDIDCTFCVLAPYQVRVIISINLGMRAGL